MKILKKVVLVMLAVCVMMSSISVAAADAVTQVGSPDRVDISAQDIQVSNTTLKYNGKWQNPDGKIIVTVNGKTLTPDVDYVVTAKSHKYSGTYALVITGLKGYKGVYETTYTIKGSKSQKIKVTTKKKAKKTYKKSALKKKSKTVALSVKNAKGKITYSVLKGSSKYIKVSKKGVVTLKKGIKKGTYKIKVRVAGKGTYNPTSKTITFKIK